MRVFVFAICWNEMRLLPWFMEHYKPFVHRFVILDDGSTDGSIEYLRSQANVSLIEAHREGCSYIDNALQFWNNQWKAVRDEADWILTCDIDEHIYHPDPAGYLRRCHDEGVTLIPAAGYEMVGRRFPRRQGRLCDAMRVGSEPRTLIGNPSRLDKIMVFDPKAIDEINFAPGRHSAEPVGRLVRPGRRELKMLHYKYISLDYVITRYSELRSGLSLADRERGWGSQYLWERKAIHRNHQLITLMAQIVVPASRLEDLRLRATLLPWKLMALLHLTLDVAMTPRSWLRALRLLLAKGNG